MDKNTEKIKKAWEKFQNRMFEARKKRDCILEKINKDLDEQRIVKIKKEIQSNG
jgi:hypothetical protein